MKQHNKKEVGASSAGVMARDTSPERLERIIAWAEARGASGAPSTPTALPRKVVRGAGKGKSPPVKPAPPLQSLRAAQQKLTAEQVHELAENRRKALLRLIDKRREIQRNKIRQSETQRLEDNAFRIRWREEFKEKRREQLTVGLDKSTLKGVISREPDVLHELLDYVKHNDKEDEWGALLSDLPLKAEDQEGEEELYADLAASLSPRSPIKQPQQHAQLSAAEEFLKKSFAGGYLLPEEEKANRRRGSSSMNASGRNRLDSSPRISGKGTAASNNGAANRSRTATTDSPSFEDAGSLSDGGEDVMNAKASLSDCLFLVGPSPEEINSLFPRSP